MNHITIAPTSGEIQLSSALPEPDKRHRAEGAEERTNAQGAGLWLDLAVVSGRCERAEQDAHQP